MYASGEYAEEEKDLPVQGRDGDGLERVAFLFPAEAGLLEFLVLRPDAGALQPVDDNVAIFLNELEELLGSPRRPRRQHSEARQAPQQDGREVLHMVVGMPGTEAEMEAQHVEGGVCLEVMQNEEQLLLERVEVAFCPPFETCLISPFWHLSSWTAS